MKATGGLLAEYHEFYMHILRLSTLLLPEVFSLSPPSDVCWGCFYVQRSKLLIPSRLGVTVEIDFRLIDGDLVHVSEQRC